MESYCFCGGYLISALANVALLYKVHEKKSSYGISEDTQICLLVAILSRVYWTKDTRLAETIINWLELGCSLLIQLGVCALLYWYRSPKERWLRRAPYILGGTLVLAIFINPGISWLSKQILVSWTIFLETAGLVPQLFALHKSYEIEAFTSGYVLMTVLARLVRMVFWAILYVKNELFLVLFVPDVISLGLSLDYLYQWLFKLQFNRGPLIPTRMHPARVIAGSA